VGDFRLLYYWILAQEIGSLFTVISTLRDFKDMSPESVTPRLNRLALVGSTAAVTVAFKARARIEAWNTVSTSRSILIAT